MKKLLGVVLSLVALVTLNGIAWADDVNLTPVGYWKTIDDKTGQARSIVRIVEINGELRGRIEKLLAPPKDDPDPICKKCTGDKKNKHVRGLEFLWGFKRQSKGWSDGYVLDPEEGQTYHGNIQVIDGGKRLKLFGYVRVIIKIGRGQVWERVSPP
jgi:uncharacterized protein (DUF2147 family)